MFFLSIRIVHILKFYFGWLLNIIQHGWLAGYWFASALPWGLQVKQSIRPSLYSVNKIWNPVSTMYFIIYREQESTCKRGSSFKQDIRQESNKSGKSSAVLKTSNIWKCKCSKLQTDIVNKTVIGVKLFRLQFDNKMRIES